MVHTNHQGTVGDMWVRRAVGLVNTGPVIVTLAWSCRPSRPIHVIGNWTQQLFQTHPMLNIPNRTIKSQYATYSEGLAKAILSKDQGLWPIGSFTAQKFVTINISWPFLDSEIDRVTCQKLKIPWYWESVWKWVNKKLQKSSMAIALLLKHSWVFRNMHRWDSAPQVRSVSRETDSRYRPRVWEGSICHIHHRFISTMLRYHSYHLIYPLFILQHLAKLWSKCPNCWVMQTVSYHTSTDDYSEHADETTVY